MPSLEEALYDESGEPVEVTRIEIEIIGTNFRWTLWSDQRRLYSITAMPDQVAGCMRSTQVLMDSNLPPKPSRVHRDGT